MRSKLKAALNFYIYSSIHVSIAAAIFASEIYFIGGSKPDLNFVLFVFFSTSLTYSLHRIIGLGKLSRESRSDRFLIVESLMPWIKALAILSIIGIGFSAFELPGKAFLHFLIAGVISLLYVLPVMESNKRLRDLPYIKILLISFVWAYVASIAAVVEENIAMETGLIFLLFLEKLIYIFLITLPFDIRDLEIDRSMNVKTLVQKMGADRTYKLIYTLLVLNALVWIGIHAYFGFNPIQLGIIASMLIFSFIMIRISEHERSDKYYSWILDGAITVRSIMIITAFYIFA